MKLEKAIEILESNGLKPEESTRGDYLEAVKLGNEALKRYKIIRANFSKLRQDLLPGETQD